MATHQLPLVPSIAEYRFGMTLNNVLYIIDLRWNSSESAWYMDWYKEDETPIAIGIKVVLGAYLGRRCGEAPFTVGVLVAVDTSGAKREAGFDDLGTRVVVRYIPVEDLIMLRSEAGV